MLFGPQVLFPVADREKGFSWSSNAGASPAQCSSVESPVVGAGRGKEERRGFETGNPPTLELTTAPVSCHLVLKAGLFLEILPPHCLCSSAWGLFSGQSWNINSPHYGYTSRLAALRVTAIVHFTEPRTLAAVSRERGFSGFMPSWPPQRFTANPPPLGLSAGRSAL